MRSNFKAEELKWFSDNADDKCFDFVGGAFCWVGASGKKFANKSTLQRAVAAKFNADFKSDRAYKTIAKKLPSSYS